jgi:hypothetical protein
VDSGSARKIKNTLLRLVGEWEVKVSDAAELDAVVDVVAVWVEDSANEI